LVTRTDRDTVLVDEIGVPGKRTSKTPTTTEYLSFPAAVAFAC
jgi:hypothetical protein